MKVPFVDLQSQLKSIRPEIEAGFNSVLDKCNFILGEDVQKFEAEFAAYCGSKYAIGLASGLDAIHLGLRALGIGPGDEVITQANSFIASALGISQTGATPVFVDVDEKTFLPTPKAIEAAITPRTKAILPVHLYGRLIDMEPILQIAKKHNIAVVEDAAQAHGSKINGKKAGAYGTMGCFSFYPGKNLGCYGDGGMVVTDSKEVKESLEALRNYGSPKKYFHPIVGYNSRLDTIQATVLRTKLPHLDSYNERRYQAAVRYNQALEGVGDLVLPQVPQAGSHVFHLYVVRTKQRDALLNHLSSKNIGCVIHYPTPIHMHGAYKELGHKAGDFPVSEKMAGEILSLPMFPELSQEQIAYVAAEVRNFFGS